MAKIRRHLYLAGKVQGVFFRVSLKEKAEESGVQGWVRNIPNGEVEVVLEGEKGAVQKLVQWCRKGPPAARVGKVKFIAEEYEGKFNKFEVI